MSETLVHQLVWFVWAGIGAGLHIWHCQKLKTYCGKPIWRDPSAYFMFLPAMIAGPLMLLA